MKALSIIFTFLAFPFLFYAEPAGMTGKIPCDIIFISNLSRDLEEIPFSYESECELSTMKVDIFNNWGEHVKTIDDLDFQWFGEALPPKGTYYYVAKFKFEHENSMIKKSGTIEIFE